MKLDVPLPKRLWLPWKRIMNVKRFVNTALVLAAYVATGVQSFMAARRARRG